MQNPNLFLTRPFKSAEVRAVVLPDGRWLLHDTRANTATTLSASAGVLWELCDGQTTFTDIVNQLKALYPDTPADTLKTEAEAALLALVEQGLLTYGTGG